MELAQRAYMAEAPPWTYDETKAARLRPVLKDILRNMIDWAQEEPGPNFGSHAMSQGTRLDNTREIRAPRGSEITAKSWLTEAPLRMLMNNLDPDVAENPNELVVYGGIGARPRATGNATTGSSRACERLQKATRPCSCSRASRSVSFKTHADAPRVLIANSNLVPHWANWDSFHELDRKGLMMYGQMTAGSWIYIASQGIVQGTYETFVEDGPPALRRRPRGQAGS